jgi:hypothetical protein
MPSGELDVVIWPAGGAGKLGGKRGRSEAAPTQTGKGPPVASIRWFRDLPTSVAAI